MSPYLRLWLHRLGVVTVLAWLLGYTMMPLGVSAPNERSRLYLTHAMVEHGTFQIDAERRKFGRSFDEAVYQGEYFSDKAPGASLLAVPAYALYRAVSSATPINAEQLLLLGRYGVMLPISLVGFFALQNLATSLGLRRRTAELIAWTSLVATPSFHYAAAFFGHHLVAVLWLLAALVLVKTRQWKGYKARLGHGAFGLLLGMAQLTEYQALLGTVTLLGLWLVTFRRSLWSSIPALLLAALPCAVFLGYYQATCFGGPFELSYHHLANPTLSAVHNQGTGGVIGPSLERLATTLFSLHRGLLATAPCLLLCPLGIWGLWRRGHVAFAVTLLVLAMAYIGFMASSLTWEAGWGYGPRLLLPIVPFLVLLLGFAAEHFGSTRWFWSLFASAWVASLLSVQLVTAFFPEPPVEFRNPLMDVVQVLIQADIYPAHLGSRLLGLAGVWSLLPLGLLLLGPCWVFCRAGVEATGGRRWLATLPVVPAVLSFVVLSQGPSVGAREQAEFARFVSPSR